MSFVFRGALNFVVWRYQWKQRKLVFNEYKFTVYVQKRKWANLPLSLRRVWRYQRGKQNPYIEEKQTIQWPKEKVQTNKQRSTKQTHKAKDGVTRTPLKTGGERRCFGRVSSSCSTIDTRRVNLVTNYSSWSYNMYLQSKLSTLKIR